MSLKPLAAGGGGGGDGVSEGGLVVLPKASPKSSIRHST